MSGRGRRKKSPFQAEKPGKGKIKDSSDLLRAESRCHHLLSGSSANHPAAGAFAGNTELPPAAASRLFFAFCIIHTTATSTSPRQSVGMVGQYRQTVATAKISHSAKVVFRIMYPMVREEKASVPSVADTKEKTISVVVPQTEWPG